MTPTDANRILVHYGLAEEGCDSFLMISCPFHNENAGSLSFDLSKGLFYCFGCEAKGDMIAFVARLEQCDSFVALRKVVKILGGFKSSPRVVVPPVNRKLAREEAFLFFNTLPKPRWLTIGSNYMLDRGFDFRTLSHFDVRLNPSSTHPVIIPLYQGNRFAGYVSRRTDAGEPRYWYNKGFMRRDTLVGKVVDGPVLVVEGIMDLMKAWQFGYHNSCAILGWKCAVHQLRLISAVQTSLICALDSDAAGERGYEYLRSKFKRVRRFKFKKGVKDVGAINSKKAFWEGIEKAS